MSWTSIITILAILFNYELQIQICMSFEEPDDFIVNTPFHSAWKEKELIQWILQDYDKRSRPVFDNITKLIKTKHNDDIQQITVEFGLRLIQILDLNEMEQVLTTSVRLLYRWKDLHLEWDPEEFQNIKSVFIPSNLIWIPDIALYNYADERLEERRPCAAKVSSDGTVEWQPMAIYKSTCFVNIKYFPFDIQTCWLKFGPWTYDGFRVNITFYNDKNYLDLESLVPSPEWTILSSWAKHKEIFYPCCEEPYPDISFYVKIRRSSTFYTYILILPCFLLSSLTLVIFWMPPESPAKMVLGMNIFVAFFLMLLLLQDTTPSASRNFPLIGTYYCVNMGVITLSTFLSCIIVNLHFRGDNMHEVPFWLRKLVFNYCMKVLCFDLGSNVERQKMQDFPPSIRNQSLKLNLENSFNNKIIEENNKRSSLSPKNFNDSNQSAYQQRNFIKDYKQSSISSIYKNTSFNSFSEIHHDREIDERTEKEDFQRLQFVRDTKHSCFQISISPTLNLDQYRSNSNNFFENPESCSPLNSPTMKSSLHFIDENVNTSCHYSGKDSEHSSNFRLQDTATVSLSPFCNLKKSMITDLSFNKSDFGDTIKLENKTFQPFKNSSSGSIQSIDELTDHQLFGLSADQYETICNDVKVIVKSLKYIQKFQENKENVSRIFSEWRSVGLVLDRLFFFCYLFTVIFSIIMYFPKIYMEE